MRSEQREEERIPFAAVAEADADALYWFVDDRYVGKAGRSEVLFWRPSVGSFDVRVVDDHGRAAGTRVEVRVVN